MSLPSGRNHVVERNGRDESAYLFRIIDARTNRKSHAVLTNEVFPTATSERLLLLTGDDSLLTTSSERNRFRELKALLESTSSGRLHVTKSLVNDFAEGRKRIEGVRIVVHRFGPVPALVLDSEEQISVHGRPRTVRFAIFPGGEDVGAGRKKHAPLDREFLPPFARSRSQFRRSLTLSPEYVFGRYFEDVAEDFHDIRRTATDIFKRAKAAEVRLAESIGSKLNVLIPAPDVKASPFSADKEAWRIFSANDRVIYETAIARTEALRLLNLLYPIIGIASQASRYEARLGSYHSTFTERLGETRSQQIRDDSTTLDYLGRLHKHYHSPDLFVDHFTAADELLRMSEERVPGWLREFAKFCAFVLLAQRLSAPAHRARVFVSYHHDVPASSIVRRQVQQLLERERTRTAVALAIADLPGGAPLRHVLRAAIWVSHGTIAICPAVGPPAGSNRPARDYKWIARESDYALILNKRILFGSERGVDHRDVLRDFGDPRIGYLIGGSKLPSNEERAERLRKRFTDYVQAPFQIENADTAPAPMDPSLQRSILQFADGAIGWRAEHTLDGYLSQFDLETARILLCVLTHLGPLRHTPRPWIIERLQAALGFTKGQATRGFERMWSNVKKREIVLGNRTVCLLALDHRRQYFERLHIAIKLLIPSLSREKRLMWREACLRRHVTEVESRLSKPVSAQWSSAWPAKPGGRD